MGRDARRKSALGRVIKYFKAAVDAGNKDKAGKHFVVLESTAAALGQSDEVKKELAATISKFQKMSKDKGKDESSKEV
jgi:ribosomal protein S20